MEKAPTEYIPNGKDITAPMEYTLMVYTGMVL